MQADGRFFQQVQVGSDLPARAFAEGRQAFGEFADEFEALCFTAGERGAALAEREVAEPGLGHQPAEVAEFRVEGEELGAFFESHRQEVGRGFAVPADGAGDGAVTRALAFFARDIGVGEEAHLQLHASGARARFAAPARGIEGEEAGPVSADRGFGQRREALADQVPGADVRRWRRARRLADRLLVDDHQLAEGLQASEVVERGFAAVGDDVRGFLAVQAVLLLGDRQLGCGRDQVGHQRALARAGDAADDREAAGREGDVEVLEVAERSLLQADPILGGFLARDGPARAAQRVRDGRLQRLAGDGVRVGFEVARRAFGDDPSAVDAGARPKVDDAVRRAHGVFVVFDDEDRVATVAEPAERFDEAVVVARVQADTRFVEDVQGARQRRAQLGREPNALGFPAGEGVGAAVQGEVA